MQKNANTDENTRKARDTVKRIKDTLPQVVSNINQLESIINRLWYLHIRTLKNKYPESLALTSEELRKFIPMAQKFMDQTSSMKKINPDNYTHKALSLKRRAGAFVSESNMYIGSTKKVLIQDYENLPGAREILHQLKSI